MRLLGEELRKSLARNFRAARKAAGLTQRAVHEITGVDAASVSRIEAATWNASLDTVAKLAAAVRVEPSQLLSSPKDPDPNPEK